MSDKQVERMDRVMGFVPGKQIKCTGFTCAQLATRALEKGTGVRTSLTGMGTLTVSGTIMKFARLQAREKPGSQVRIEFHAIRSPLRHYYRLAKRYDGEEIEHYAWLAGQGAIVAGKGLAIAGTFGVLLYHTLGL